MSAANKAVIARIYSEVSRGNLSIIEELLTPDFVEREVTPDLPPTRAGVRQMFEGMRTAFPDFQIHAEDIIAEGEKVFVRAAIRGTQRGPFMGVPASGKQINIIVADFFRLSQGKIVEHWGVADTGSMLKQLGTA